MLKICKAQQEKTKNISKLRIAGTQAYLQMYRVREYMLYKTSFACQNKIIRKCGFPQTNFLTTEHRLIFYFLIEKNSSSFGILQPCVAYPCGVLSLSSSHNHCLTQSNLKFKNLTFEHPGSWCGIGYDCQ